MYSSNHTVHRLKNSKIDSQQTDQKMKCTMCCYFHTWKRNKEGKLKAIILIINFTSVFPEYKHLHCIEMYFY